MGNGLLTDEEKPYFSLSRPLDPSLYTAQPPAYTQQFVPTAQPSVTDQPDEYRPYDVQGLVSAQFQADRGQVDKLNGMAGKFRQRAALTANALEKRRLNAQAAIWEKRAKDLVAQTGEAIADDTVDELSAVFADLKKRREFPKTESQYHQFMFSHGYKEKEDHDAYKFVWSSYGGGQGDYAIKTLFNKDGEHININTRLGEQQARNKGYVYATRGSDATSTALAKTNEEIALIDKMDLAAETYGEDSEQYKRAKRSLDIFRSNLVSRTETGSPGAFSLGKSDSEQASAELVDQSFDLGNFSNLLQDVEKFSKATGLRGVGIEVIGGVLGQINPALEDGFVQTLGGMSTEDAANLRNRLQLAVVSLIPEYTGEESNRISDRERVLAENASRLKSITASPRQIRTALLNVLELKFAGRMRNLIALTGRPQYDLFAKDKEERNSNLQSLGQRLMDYGMSKDEALNMMVNIKSLQKELMELASLRNESN